MRHLVICSPLGKPGLTGAQKKFNLASTLTHSARHLSGSGGGPESVDAAMVALYKTANGGGRNPAADVL